MSQCTGVSKVGGYRCQNQAKKGGRCMRHQPKATHSADGERVARRVKPELFTRTVSNSVGRMYDENPIGSKEVIMRFGDAELTLSWNHGMQAFELRSTHKGLRDGMIVIPDCSNRVFIKVGFR